MSLGRAWYHIRMAFSCLFTKDKQLSDHGALLAYGEFDDLTHNPSYFIELLKKKYVQSIGANCALVQAEIIVSLDQQHGSIFK